MRTLIVRPFVRPSAIAAKKREFLGAGNLTNRRFRGGVVFDDVLRCVEQQRSHNR